MALLVEAHRVGYHGDIMRLYLDETHVLNELVVPFLRKRCRVCKPVAHSSDYPDPRAKAPTDAKVVRRLWDELATALPRDCRRVVYGTPALVHPQFGIVFAVAIGAEYALRLIEQDLPDAEAAGLLRARPQADGEVLDVTEKLGTTWRYGNWCEAERDWVSATFESVGGTRRFSIEPIPIPEPKVLSTSRSSADASGRPLEPRTIDAVRSILRPWLDKHSRTAWIPITSARRWRKSRASSHFMGTPFLLDGEAWPTCPNCDERMALFVQLDLSAVPQELSSKYGEGLLQLFYCTTLSNDPCKVCDVVLSGWEPYSPAQVVRVVHPPVEAFRQKYVVDRSEYGPARFITGWRECADLPSPSEFDALGLLIDYDFDRDTAEVRCPEFDVMIRDWDNTIVEEDDVHDHGLAEALGRCIARDKLAGWPNWVQNVEYPSCRVCGERMNYMLQIESEDNLAWMLGDMGCGHIFQCPEHRDIVAFSWACS